MNIVGHKSGSPSFIREDDPFVDRNGQLLLHPFVENTKSEGNNRNRLVAVKDDCGTRKRGEMGQIGEISSCHEHLF